jgi:hypothetical protein
MPRLYSEVTDSTPSPTTAISPTRTPVRLSRTTSSSGGTTARSPEPLTVKPPARSVASPSRAGRPTSRSVQDAPGGDPAGSTRTLSKVAVAAVGWPPIPTLPNWRVTWTASGEATNSPICTVDGRPARSTVPTRRQAVPSTDS